MSILGYLIFHCGHFFGGKALDVFIDFEHSHVPYSKDPDKWLRPQAVQICADCSGLKAVEFS